MTMAVSGCARTSSGKKKIFERNASLFASCRCMNCVMTLLVEDPIPTRYTLLSRLEDRGDQDSWKDFFDTYWRLIYSVAVKSGLTEAEAQDVVQETIISDRKSTRLNSSHLGISY